MDDRTTRPAAPAVARSADVPITRETRADLADRTPEVRFDEPVTVRDRPWTDRVRWGPIWAGLVITLAVFTLLQLTLFATDAISIDINPTESSNAVPFWTGLAAVVAFFLGGLVSAAATQFDRVDDGILQGVVLWALAVVTLLVLSVVGVSFVTSALGDLADRLTFIEETVTTVDSGGFDESGAVSNARDAAASAVLVLGITIVATVVGAAVGSKIWPRRHRYSDDHRLAA